ncbi:MAG: hypothetical protein IPH06_05425 [Alphaproteobacteria bacterium]|nr:hypothetical protein [Alphaproteobacteria bacterium]QQS57462.1 MAG: hypothetical protein IPN28_01190 [Alphaproteobacteria bacterium]
MASFDFIKAAVKGYQFVWLHRVELLKFSFPVVFIGVFCEFVIIQAGMEENILRRGLLDLPAVFAQGYFLAELVRYAIYGEPFVLWGYTRRSKLEEFNALYVSRMQDARRRSIIYASVILFVLQMVVADVLMGLSALGAEKEIKPPPEAMSTADVLSSLPEAFIAVLILFAAFWSIRLGFLYVSLALGYGIREYLQKLRGLSSSVSLFLCSFFVMLLLVFPAEMLLKLLTIIFADLPAVWVVTTAIVREYIAIILLSVVTVASAYGIKDMVEGPPPPRLNMFS